MILMVFFVGCFFLVPFFLSGQMAFFLQYAVSGLNLNFSFFSLMNMFAASLTLIFFCIVLYSFSYFGTSIDFIRFIFLLFSFFISMFILIYHNSSLSLFLGWDGLGVTSYLLVCYYFNWKSLNGAMTTLMTNRIGDVCLFWFMIISMQVDNINVTQYMYSLPILILILGSFTKSAQTPFSSWLPQAMSAPTPVSSLVHSSTLVTAGVFLLLKYFFFLSSFYYLFGLTVFGTTTIFLAGLSATVEKDSKKIVALSTLSQMGLLIFSVGASMPFVGFIHMLTHAFFKSCMFVQVGSFISTSFGGQESRIQSSTFSGALIPTFMFLGCVMSLCGLMFTSGFISKDLLVSLSNFGVLGFFFQFLMVFGILLTFLYSARMVSFLCSSSPKMLQQIFPPLPVFFSSMPLFFGGILGGYGLSTNTSCIPLSESFLDKFLPIFFLFLFVLTSYFFLLENFFFNMCQMDFFSRTFNNILFYPAKSVDYKLDQMLQNNISDMIFFSTNLKNVNMSWPIGGLFMTFFLVFFFYLSFGVLA